MHTRTITTPDTAPRQWSYSKSCGISNQKMVRFLVASACQCRSKYHQFSIGGHLVPCAAFESATCFLLLNATPLFEKEGNVGFQTLIPNILDPFGIDRTSARPRLSAHDGPVNSSEF